MIGRSEILGASLSEIAALADPSIGYLPLSVCGFFLFRHFGIQVTVASTHQSSPRSSLPFERNDRQQPRQKSGQKCSVRERSLRAPCDEGAAATDADSDCRVNLMTSIAGGHSLGFRAQLIRHELEDFVTSFAALQ
jgi:hypothetical protein